MWNLKNSQGQTPRGILESVIERENYVAKVRIEPATEKQKEKLRYFGYAFDEQITKGQASDALDKCARDFPEVNQAYYNRPATEEQLAHLRPILKADDEIPEDYADEGKPLTYQQAKDLIWQSEMENRHRDRVSEIEENACQLVIMEFLRWECGWDGECYPNLTFARVKTAAKALDKTNPGWTKDDKRQNLLRQKVMELYPGIYEEDEMELKLAMKAGITASHLDVGKLMEQTNDDAPTEEQLQKIAEMELKLDRKAGITASQLDELLKLEGETPRAEDLELFAQQGIAYYEGDAFSIYGAADLVRCFEKMYEETGDYTNISMASAAASEDPAVKKATITLDQSGKLAFTWPKRKLEQWYRKGAEY